MHCVRGQSGTSSAKEGIGEVGIQHQEVSSPVFSADLASGQLQFWENVVNFWQCMSCLLRVAAWKMWRYQAIFLCLDGHFEQNIICQGCELSMLCLYVVLWLEESRALNLPVFSCKETESRSGCQSSRAAPNDSACEVSLNLPVFWNWPMVRSTVMFHGTQFSVF